MKIRIIKNGFGTFKVIFWKGCGKEAGLTNNHKLIILITDVIYFVTGETIINQNFLRPKCIRIFFYIITTNADNSYENN